MSKWPLAKTPSCVSYGCLPNSKLSKRQFVLRGVTTEVVALTIFVRELGASEAVRFMQACMVRDCQDHRHKRLRTRSAITSCGLWMNTLRGHGSGVRSCNDTKMDRVRFCNTISPAYIKLADVRHLII